MLHPVLRRRLVVACCVLCVAGTGALFPSSAFAQAAAERPADKDVKALIDQVDEGRDKFEGNLDGKFKGSTIRNANGETKVSGALQDYQDSTQKLKERFTADYAASAEVSTVLKQSGAIDGFMRRQAASMKGRPEWDRQAANLQRLAVAYGATFPLADGAVVRRMNDKETAATAEANAEASDRFKSDLDRATGMAKADKDAAKKDAELVGKQANLVKSRAGDGKPAGSEMRLLVAQLAGLQPLVDKHSLSGTTNWQSMQASLGKLQQAYGLKP
jgi:hypothetical protein